MIVDYEVRGNSPVVHTWTRNAHGERIHETDTDFEPYFFVHQDANVPDDDRVKRVETDGNWRSNQGHPLKKVVAHNPKTVGGRGGLKTEFTQTWESDVYFRSRYWLDKIPEDQIPDTKYRIIMYDIEVDHSLEADKAPEEITSITAYDNYMDKYVSFLLDPPSEQTVEGFKGDDWSLYVFEDERQMLLKFLDFVKDTNPDIMSAWNGETYDDPYLVNRMRQKRIDYSELSPINRVDLIRDNSQVRMKGREMIDMIPAFKKVYFSDLESYRLNDVGANLLGKEKIHFDGTGAQLWRDNPMKLIEYNKRDVEIMVDLDQSFDIWDMLKEVQQWVGINLSDIIHNSRVCQAYFMRKMNSRLPPKGWDENQGGSFKGAKVLEETPGLSKNVAVLDLKAQYPSSMISNNMSPEMKIEDDMEPEDIAEQFIRPTLEDWDEEQVRERFDHEPEELQEVVEDTSGQYRDRLEEIIEEHTVEVGTGAQFWYGEMGAIPRVLIEMIQERDKHKELRDDAEPDSDVYERHERRQFALKFVINSVYGVMGHVKFPLYDRDVARSTTYVGRKTIEWAVEAAQDLGYEVVYGDTDSIMISMGEEVDSETALEKAKKLEKYINETYDEYAEEMGIDTSKFDGVDRNHFFEIEAEKLYRTFFMTRAQKKYAGKMVWKEGSWLDSEYDFAQFGKRSSDAQISRDVVEHVLIKILEEQSKEDIQEYITDKCNKMKNKEYDLDYIGIPSKMKKEMEDYKTDRPILRGVKFTNKYLDEEFGKGDKPKYVYVKGTPPGMPNTDVVAFSQSRPSDEFRIDWEKMINKDIRQKLKRILTVQDWEWKSVYRTNQSLLDI